MKLFFVLFFIAISSVDAQENYPTIFGHRGCRGLLPENTIEAFQRAIDLGVDGIEWDIVINKDKQIVISHEPYMEKKYCLMPDSSEIKDEKSLNIFRMSQKEIKQYDCGSKQYSKFPEQQKIKAYKPLFKEVIEKIDLSNTTILFEIKSDKKLYDAFQPQPTEYVDIILKEIELFEYKENIIFMSFDANIINELHKKAPQYKLVYLTYSPFSSVKKCLKDLTVRPYALGIYNSTISKKDVLNAHQLEIKVFAWTVNKEKDVKKLTNYGVDGIITDYPNKYVR